MISMSSSGAGFKKVASRLERLRSQRIFDRLDKFGKEGVAALAAATPVDTGLTAASWSYEVRHDGSVHSIIWHNHNINNGSNVAILIQYGHGTGTGGYVVGRDYINPVILPLFERILADVREAVSSA
jgi:hypothetical protein